MLKRFIETLFLAFLYVLLIRIKSRTDFKRSPPTPLVPWFWYLNPGRLLHLFLHYSLFFCHGNWQNGIIYRAWYKFQIGSWTLEPIKFDFQISFTWWLKRLITSRRDLLLRVIVIKIDGKALLRLKFEYVSYEYSFG